MTVSDTANNHPVSLQDAHILVVADNVPNFVMIARMLAQIGVTHCEWRTSGWQVVQVADSLPALDLVLLDIHLPYEDGFQALHKLRTHPRLRETRIVALTDSTSQDELERAQEAGFDGFLTTPLNPERFPDQIKRLLAGEPVWERP
jgi:CheY-like chemotaxis protein